MGTQRKNCKNLNYRSKRSIQKNEEEHKARHKKQEEREHLVLFTTL